MAKSVTVNFEDGTNHVYENVPDDVTNDQVQERAQKDYPDAKIMDFEHNAASAPATTAPAPATANGPVAPLSMTDKAVAGAQTAAQLALEHPGIAAGAAGLYKANQFANKYMAGKDIDRSIAQQQADTAAENARLQRERMAERMGRPANAPMEAPGAQPQRPMGFVNTNTPPNGPTASAPAQPMQQPQMGQARPAMSQMHPAMPAPAPTAPPVPQTPPAGGVPGQQGASFIENIAQKYSQLAGRFAPALQAAAESPLGRVATGAMRIAGSAPVMGAQLATHSEGLNTNEDQLLADKHRLEAQMLLNKHAAEWNKYKNAAQAR